MKIIKLNIVEFGGIKNREICLSDGMNIISGDNESGKSTVMLFIRFMLYGLPKKGAKGTVRERALSWDNRRAEGSMLIERGGREIRIERRAAAVGSKLNESLSCVDVATGENIDGEPGLVLLGVPAEVFESSCGISQMRAADVNGDKATSAIENMLVSADESIDVSRVLAVMDNVRKEYKHIRGEGGAIYETEQQIIGLRVKQREATEKHLKYNEMSARLVRSEKNLEKISASHKEATALLDQINGALVLRRFEELDKKRAELDSTKMSLFRLNEQERRGDFMPSEAHVSALKGARLALNEAKVKYTLRQRACEGLPELDEQKKPLAERGEKIREVGGAQIYLAEANDLNRRGASKKKMGVAMCIAGAVLAAVGAVLATVTLIATIAAVGVGALLIVLGVANGATSRKLFDMRDQACERMGVSFDGLDEYVKACLTALAEREEIQSRTLTEKTLLAVAKEELGNRYTKLSELVSMTVTDTSVTADGIMNVALAEEERIAKACAEREELTRHIYAMSLMVEKMEEELSEYDREKLSLAVTIDMSELTPQAIERAKMREKFDRERYAMLDRETRNIRESLAALGGGLTESPVKIADRIEALEQKLTKQKAYYEALMLAKSHIEEASASMSGNVTPVIGKKAGEMLALVSGGAHSSVQTTKKLDLTVEQGGFHVDADLLSGGTRDAAYICLRISLMMRLFGTELPPLIMDESLCQMDDTRATNMLTMLGKLSEDTAQCIILTCHGREAKICKELQIEANEIQL